MDASCAAEGAQERKASFGMGRYGMFRLVSGRHRSQVTVAVPGQRGEGGALCCGVTSPPC